MSQNKSDRTPRNIALADHLWQALELMAQEMGSDREALINQAVFNFARLNGYVTPGRVSAQPVEETPAPSPSPTVQALPAARREEDLLAAVESEAQEPLEEEEEEQEEAAPEEEEAAPGPALTEGNGEEPEQEQAAPGKALFVVVRNQQPQRVNGDRFIIGRGKHCDLIIESNRVSREHAVVVRDGDTVLIEDLKSSNGTWFNQKRISRRKIEDGDEFTLGTERLKFLFRSVSAK